MKTRTIAFAIALLAGAAGCKADNHGSIELFAICGFPEDAESCSTSGECDTVLAGRPEVDTVLFVSSTAVAFNQLDLFIEMRNQLPVNSDPSAGRVNTNDAIIESYELSFAFQDTFQDAANLLPFGLSVPDVSFPAVSTIPANSTSTPMVPLIPRETMEQISEQMFASDFDGFATVIVTLRVKGHREDGSHFETAEHDYAVDLFDFVAAPPSCPPGEIVMAVCPHIGQTMSVTCERPVN